jgi:hypothetical protein
MDPQFLPDAHGYSGTCVDAIEPRLRSAPYAETGGKLLIDRTGESRAAIDERVALADAHVPR